MAHFPVIATFKKELPHLKITSIEDTVVLGSPIAPRGIRNEIMSKQEALKRMVSKLELIDPHQAFVLLKNSMAIPKLTYLLRSSPAYKEADLLQEFDEIVRSSLSQITNVDIKEKAWTQASFPA